MYKSNITILCILMCLQVTLAQPPPPDTVWGGTPWQRAILDAPVISGQSQAVNIVPNGNHCFDKQVKIKITKGSEYEQCLFFNTTDGYVGYLQPLDGASGGLCDIKPDTEDFTVFIIGLKGNVYTYRTTESRGGFQYTVSTGNTQTHQYNMNTSVGGTAQLRRKTGSRSYCNNRISAQAYKYDNKPEVYYLFGGSYPPVINVSSNKYLGNFGIGYNYTDKGLYLCMELVSDLFSAKIMDVKDVNTCFNSQPFQHLESRMTNNRTAELQKERDKIARYRAGIRAGDECAAAMENIAVFRTAQLQIQEENLEKMQQGNTYQNLEAQKATLGMMDPLFVVQGNILDIHLSICRTEIAVRRNNSGSAADKLGCLRTQLARLHTAETQMSALDARYSTEPGRAFAEKSRIYLDVMRGSSCN
ncbi:MAG: hypothetical protein V4717_06285 [Bacteroidota bacterium]